VFSPDTISAWARKDMSNEAILRRLRAKARPRLFSDEQEKVLAGWCVYKDLVNESSTSSNFREFAFSQFRRDVKPSYLSKFLRRHRLSLKLTGNAAALESIADKGLFSFLT
jgi:transposase